VTSVGVSVRKGRAALQRKHKFCPQLDFIGGSHGVTYSPTWPAGQLAGDRARHLLGKYLSLAQFSSNCVEQSSKHNYWHQKSECSLNTVQWVAILPSQAQDYRVGRQSTVQCSAVQCSAWWEDRVHCPHDIEGGPLQGLCKYPARSKSSFVRVGRCDKCK
jgi:hypothetical protein